jgi:hypothetical protein
LGLEKNKKRYLLDINNNKDENKFNDLLKNINFEVKSFYPKSYLKMLNIKKEENKNNNVASINLDVEKKEIKNDNNSNNFL